MLTDIDKLRELFSYCQETGSLKWRINRRMARAGSEAGTIDREGYRQVTVNGKRLSCHRIAWAMVHGEWPAGSIDHIDGFRGSNRISNLRDVSQCVNLQNRKRADSTNRSGASVPGVCFKKGARKYVVTAWRAGKQVHVGLFHAISDAEAASLAYRRANYPGFTL